MNKANPKICIIILNWNGYDLTRACLLSLQDITYPDYEIILVDNGSVDQSGELLAREFQNVDFLKFDKNHGFTGGNNKGIAYAQKKYKPEYFLLLNNDTEVQRDFLDHLVEPFFKDNRIYATVPKIYYYSQKDTIWFAGGHVRKITGNVKEYGKDKKDTNRTSVQTQTGFMTGCAALIHSKAISNIGYLDDQFFAYSEDADYSLRIIKSGHSIVFVPQSIVYHKVSKSFKTTKGASLKYYLATRNIVYLQKKHLSRHAFLVFVAWFPIRWVFYLTIKLLLSGNYKIIKSLFTGFFDGLMKRSSNLSSNVV